MRKKIKLVHVISILQHGGAESVLLNLIDQLGQDKYEHYVIYFHGGPSVERVKERGIPAYRITGAVMLCDPLFWIRIWRCIKSINPDLIHAHLWAANFSARVIGRLLGIPVVNTIHNKLVFQGAFRNTIDFVSMPLAQAVIGVGSVIVSSGKRWPYDEKNIACIPNGIDVDAIYKRAMHEQVFREQLGWTQEHVVIGSVGRFEDQKNYHTLLRAFARMHAHYNQTRLLLVGGGSLEHSLRLLVTELGIEGAVQFVVGKTAYGYYPLMDAFVLSSHYEGLSIALLEAISCGVPCLSTGNNGIHELIQTGNTGILIQEPTQDAVYKALNDFMLLDDKGKLMARRAQELVRMQYSLEHMAVSYAQVYARLLEKNY